MESNDYSWNQTTIHGAKQPFMHVNKQTINQPFIQPLKQSFMQIQITNNSHPTNQINKPLTTHTCKQLTSKQLTVHEAN